jgi:hypothetical protein
MSEINKFNQEDKELEKMLLGHFRKWKSHVRQYLYEDEMKKLDWIDEFCKDARKDLLRLKDRGKLRDD